MVIKHNTNKEDTRSAAWRIFHRSYQIYTINRYYNLAVKKMQFGYIRHTQIDYVIGMSQEDIEKHIGDYRIQITATVPVIVELDQLDAPIGFQNSNDAYDIYLDIQEHFNDWIEALNSPLVIREPPPFGDFVKLDHLASKIFKLGRDIVTNLNRNSNIGSGVKKWYNINPNNYQYDKSHISNLNKLIVLYKKLGAPIDDDKQNSNNARCV